MSKVSFVIPAKNAGRDIEKCLASLMPYYQRGYVADIVVVDGQSKDDTVEKALRFPVKVITDPSGYPGPSWELCWRHATGDFVVYLDSDACLGQGFLPELMTFFADETVGIVGCDFTTVTDGSRFSVAEKDWTVYSHQIRFYPRGLLQRFLHRFTLGSRGTPSARGPCWAARRSEIVAVDGYRGLSARLPPDAALACRLTDRGCRTSWFLDSQVFHYTRSTFRSQIKKCVRDGRDSASWRRGMRQNFVTQMTPLIMEFASPIFGLLTAMHFRNPWVLVFSLTRYAVVLGYVQELLSPAVKNIE